MSFQYLAFFTGLFSGLHCLTMCGPLILALPHSGTSVHILVAKLLYQVGRIFTYSILGLVAGVLGVGFKLLGLQQTLSILTGLTLIAAAFFHFSGFSNALWYQRIITPLASLMGKCLSKPGGAVFAGTLHGLLPCGMVYMALATSLNAGTALAAGEFMMLFGLGTTPLLLLASASSLLFKKMRFPTSFTPSLFLAAGAFLVARGFNLDIPYIANRIVQNASAICR
jgi:uncharacterized protein